MNMDGTRPSDLTLKKPLIISVKKTHLKTDSKELQPRNSLLHFSQRSQMFSILALERQAA